MSTYTVALFGEAEKGEFQKAYYCQTLHQLEECLGNPPVQTHGLFCAVQVLLYHHDLLFFRVEQEGFSYPDYLFGFQLLETQKLIDHVTALFLPGVGDTKILEVATPYCLAHGSFLIIQEADLYDYLTAI